MVLDRKISQEYLVNEGVPQGAILGNYLPDDVICSIAIYADDTALYSKYDPAPDRGQPQCPPPPPPFLQGGAKNFEAFLKRVGLEHFYFFGGVAELQGAMVFSRRPPVLAEDFQPESLNQ